MNSFLSSYKEKKILIFISFVLLILLLTFLAVRQSFTLALGGDDWGLHYAIWSIYDVQKQYTFPNPFAYMCTYCIHYFFLSIISNIWGYEPFYYFFVSLLARTFAAISLFFIVRKLSGRTLPATLASIFFAVTYLGIETTDWVFNYNHYLGVGIVSFFLLLYIKARETGKFKHLLISGLLFALALIVSPIRVHGLLPLVLVLEFGWWLIEGKDYKFKKFLIRMGTLLIIYYIIFTGLSDLTIKLRDWNSFFSPFIIYGYGSTEWNLGRVQEGLSAMKLMLSQGRTDFLIDPIATIGNYIVPDRLLAAIPFSQITILGRGPFTFLSFLLPVTLIYGGLTYIVLYLSGLKRKATLFYTGLQLIWLFLIYFLLQSNRDTFSYARVAFALVGGSTIIFSVWLFFLLKKKKPELAQLVLLGLGWMSTSIIFPWLISPNGIILTWGRYSIQQAAGLSIWMAIIFFILISQLKARRRFFALGITYLLVLLFIFMHLKFTNDYLAHVNTYRSQVLDAKYWNKMTGDVPTLNKDGLHVFFVITDQPSAEIAEAIRFGFFGRSSIYYNITNQEYNPFVVLNDYNSIFSSVYDGKFLTKHGRKAVPTTVERIHAFLFQNKEMYNVTDQVRTRLKEDLEALNKGTLQLPTEVQ